MEDFNISFEIPGKDLPFSDEFAQFSLHSHYDTHHQFEITAAVHQISIADVKALLGEQIIITITSDSEEFETSGKQGIFKGIIDQVKIQAHETGTAYVKVSGYSPTVFLDAGTKMRAFSNKALTEITKQLMSDSNLACYIDASADKHSFPWKVQAGQCDWPFLKSLCDHSGELELYYDGEHLILADLTNNDLSNSVELYEGTSLSSLTVNFDTFPQEFTLRAFDNVAGSEINVEHQPLRSNSQLINAALEKSAFGTIGISLTHSAINSTELKKSARRMAAKQATELIVVTGNTNDPSIKIGTQLTIHTEKHLLEGELVNQQFTVISVDHQYIEPGQYNNSFVAIATDLPYNRGMTYATPEVGPLNAVVVDDKDKGHLGRIQVRLVDDPNKSTSPWLRVLQPYTGNGGCYLIPKIGDHVVVLGEDFNPDLGMVVLGSFYTKKQDAKHWPHTSTGFYSKKAGLYLDDETNHALLHGEDVQMHANGTAVIDGSEVYIASDKSHPPKRNKS